MRSIREKPLNVLPPDRTWTFSTPRPVRAHCCSRLLRPGFPHRRNWYRNRRRCGPCSRNACRNCEDLIPWCPLSGCSFPHCMPRKILHASVQLYRYFAVHTDRAAEIREFRFGIFRQVSEQPDKRGRVYVRPVSGNQGACGLFRSGKFLLFRSLLHVVNTIRIFW